MSVWSHSRCLPATWSIVPLSRHVALRLFELQAGGWLGLVVSGIAFYGAAAELLNEMYKKVGAASCGNAPLLSTCADASLSSAPNHGCCTSGCAIPATGPPLCCSHPTAPPSPLQTVLPLGVCNPGAAILPWFQSAVGAVPLLGPMYLR